MIFKYAVIRHGCTEPMGAAGVARAAVSARAAGSANVRRLGARRAQNQRVPACDAGQARPVQRGQSSAARGVTREARRARRERGDGGRERETANAMNAALWVRSVKRQRRAAATSGEHAMDPQHRQSRGPNAGQWRHRAGTLSLRPLGAGVRQLLFRPGSRLRLRMPLLMRYSVPLLDHASLCLSRGHGRRPNFYQSLQSPASIVKRHELTRV
jgi:hypothetical protein